VEKNRRSPDGISPEGTGQSVAPQALLSQRFDYQEYGRFDSSSAARMALFGGNVFGSILGSGFARWIIKPLLPKPGEGPSEKAMNEGSVECEFIGTAKSGVRVRGVLKGQGDAGNRFTVKCLCESAFVLALPDKAHSAEKPSFGGVLTPVTGLGDELTVRLDQFRDRLTRKVCHLF